MTNTKDQVEPLLREMQELLELIERSVERLDRLANERAALIFRLTMLFLCAGVVAGTFAYLYVYEVVPSRVPLIWAGIGFVIGFATVMTGVMSSAYALGRRTREIATERELNRRLVTLVDEQKRRLADQDKLSPMALATLELRLSRLYRAPE